MKKILAIFLCAVVLAGVCGCAKKVEKEENQYLIPNSNSSMRYATFEELVDSATDVVKGRVVKKVIKDYVTHFEIEVVERYKGEPVEENIIFEIEHGFPLEYVLKQNLDKQPSHFENGKEYYFVLERHKYVYYEYDIYIYSGASLYFPAENIQDSTLGGEPLAKHSDIPNDYDENVFVEYLKNTIYNRKGTEKVFYGMEYTEETDLKTIVREADIVVEVKVNTEEDSESMITDIYWCDITEVLKGDIKEEKIEVIFFEDTVKKGEKYLLALDLSTTGRYRFSSKNSMLDMKQYDEILEYVKE